MTSHSGTRTTLLIDGDIIAYKSSLANQRTATWDEGTVSVYADYDATLANAIDRINHLKRELRASKVFVAFSDSTNFRHSILPSYKGNRIGPKPIALANVKEDLKKSFNCITKPTLEADDLLGIWATGDNIKGKKIVCSIDKDLLQIPGTHHNIDSGKTSHITVAEGDLKFYTQVLTGDAVDHYKGCPGVGPKKAEKLLDGCTTTAEYWDAVVKAYEAAGLTEEDALVQARVARILRAENYNYDTKEAILWVPH